MSEDKNTNTPFGSVEVDFNVDVRIRISFDINDLPNVDEGQFYGDITEAEEFLRGLSQKVKDLKNAIAYAKKKRDGITNE